MDRSNLFPSSDLINYLCRGYKGSESKQTSLSDLSSPAGSLWRYFTHNAYTTIPTASVWRFANIFYITWRWSDCSNSVLSFLHPTFDLLLAAAVVWISKPRITQSRISFFALCIDSLSLIFDPAFWISVRFISNPNIRVSLIRPGSLRVLHSILAIPRTALCILDRDLLCNLLLPLNPLWTLPSTFGSFVPLAPILFHGLFPCVSSSSCYCPLSLPHLNTTAVLCTLSTTIMSDWLASNCLSVPLDINLVLLNHLWSCLSSRIEDF